MVSVSVSTRLLLLNLRDIGLYAELHNDSGPGPIFRKVAVSSPDWNLSLQFHLHHFRDSKMLDDKGCIADDPPERFQPPAYN